MSKSERIRKVCLFFVVILFNNSYSYKEGTNTFDIDLFKDARAVDLLPISEEGKLMWSFSPNMYARTTREKGEGK